MPGNKTSFPPAFRSKSRLHYYSSFFNSIEVNSSFYKTPQRSTYEKWAQDVPEDFEFTIKLSRDVTHVKELTVGDGLTERFLVSASGLGIKKGCLLVQFPGKINLEYFNQVERILSELGAHDPLGEWRVAIEFRNKSWYTGETTELLNHYNAAMVLHDHAKAKVFDFTGTSNFIYLRFHGPRGNYRESYSEQVLDGKAEQVKEFQSRGKDVYIYFNNTAGNAFENARYLQSKLNPEG